jgi:hypothetical protein
LRLAGRNSIRTGNIVPISALSLWNLAPEQSNFAVQTGELEYAISAPTSWTDNTGTVLELTFAVLPAVTSRLSWSVTISDIELSDGWKVERVSDSSLALYSRDLVPATLSVARMIDGSVSLHSRGAPGSTYRAETSTDLLDWAELESRVQTEEAIIFNDTSAGTTPRKFYRVIQVD